MRLRRDVVGQGAGERVLGGRYRLTERLGGGGMGTVWAGRDDVLGREVAVKEVRLLDGTDPAAQSELVERSMREARAAARLSHPGVVTVYDVVEQDGRPWIVMERLEARSLADVIREEGPLPPARVARIGLQLLGGLEAAHAAGVLHRDVKPANVLLDGDQAVLTDFGIAQSSGESSLTRTGLLVGSPAYLAPERARGLPATESSDLWALGATLFAAVEGRSPFDRGEALPTLAAVVGESPRPPLAAGSLRPALEGLLRKDPQRRLDPRQTRALLEAAAASGEEQPTAVQTVLRADEGEHDLGRTAVVPPVGAPRPAATTPPEVPPRPAPSPSPHPAPRPRRSGPTTGRLLALAAVVVLLLLVAGLLRAVGGGGDPGAGKATAPPRTSGSTSTSPSTTSTSRPPSPSSSGPTVPAGYHLVHDPTGFSVAVPDGWTQRRDGTRVDYLDPAGSSFLRIDQTDSPKPDALRDWQQQEKSVRRSLPDYRRISLQRVAYRGYNAADWEFTFGSGSSRTHVLDRGLTTGTKGYAIYWSTPDSAWSAGLDRLRVFEDTFQPAS